MKSDDATMKAHALYFVKFVEAYAAQGSRSRWPLPQTEPTTRSTPSCHLVGGARSRPSSASTSGPALMPANPTAQIMLGAISDAGDRADVAVANTVAGGCDGGDAR